MLFFFISFLRRDTHLPWGIPFVYRENLLDELSERLRYYLRPESVAPLATASSTMEKNVGGATPAPGGILFSLMT